MKNVLWIVVALIVLGGAYWYVQQGSNGTGDDFGTYAYQCEGGMEFSITPSSDLSSLHLTPGSGATFPETTLLATASTAGARYESSDIVFIGAGEGVMLTVGSTTFSCNPTPSPDSAPFNWGDAAEGAGAEQDAARAVRENILGKWQSVDDAKFVREFKAGDAVDDWYDGEVTSSGLWVAFEKGIDTPEVPYPLEDHVVYIQMTQTGTQADTLNFKLTKLTPEELELIYLDRGGALRFTRIE